MTERHSHTQRREVDNPKPCFMKVRLVKRGPFVAARIRHEDGLWWSEVEGTPCDFPHEDPAKAARVLELWASGIFIDQAEYEYMLALAAHAAEHAPNSPIANPKDPIRLKTLPPLF
jgi:hypothetical protein